MVANPIHCSQQVSFGADPEFFLVQDGKIVPSGMVIPETGLSVMTQARLVDTARTYGQDYVKRKYPPIFVRDGIQVEYHAPATTCRGNFVDFTKGNFGVLNSHLKGIETCWETVVEIPEKDFLELPEDCRRLGCQPSLNLYGDNPIGVDPSTYRFRAAGGHIHFGGLPTGFRKERFIQALDVIVGNTSVLLDRSPLGAKRRETYGRAGEYRIQPHGVEYRTLTNFWLRSAPLIGLMLGLGRIAFNLIEGQSQYNMATGVYDRVPYQAEKALFDMVDTAACVEAINTNDPDKALPNWIGLRNWAEKYLPPVHRTTGASHPIGQGYTKGLDILIDKGIDHYWPGRGHEVMERILTQGPGHGSGWEYWAEEQVRLNYNFVVQQAARNVKEKIA